MHLYCIDYSMQRIFFYVQVPLLIGNAFLVLRQLLCIAANLTTNEILSRKKYSYLRGSDGGFWNSFDRGCFANCLQFWCHSRPDWAAVYQEEQQVKIAVHHGPERKCLSCPRLAPLLQSSMECWMHIDALRSLRANME